MPPSGPTAGSQGDFLFFFFLIFMFIYLFGCTGSELQHVGSLAAWHVGSSSPIRDRTSAPALRAQTTREVRFASFFVFFSHPPQIQARGVRGSVCLWGALGTEIEGG